MRPTTTLLAAAATVLCAAAALAETSPWSEDMKSAVRLISGEAATSSMHAGVEIRLSPGWHTYWRYPGDSGVPPQFDFSKSDNLQSAKVLFPAPELHKDAGGETIGYQKDVIFPVVVMPKDPGKPVKLHLSIDYAVCETMCVPARGEATLTLPPGGLTPDPRLKSAFARVPAKATAAAAGLSVRREGNAAVVTFPASEGEPVAVYAEGPTEQWALPVPKPVANTPSGQGAFSFKLEGQPPGVDVSKPVDLTFTVVQGARAFEVTTRLD
jgi:DsbC/DsbD-like thiol-disulfide interchange protein